MSIPIPTLRIGPHKGKRFDQVPPAYLRGLLKMRGLWTETRTQIEFYLKSKSEEVSKPRVAKKDRLEYRPQYFKKTITPPARTEDQKEKFRKASRQLKERMGWGV